MWNFELDTVENWAYWNNLFTPDECKTIIEIAYKKPKKIAVVDNGKIRKNIRKSKVIWLNEQDDLIWAYQKMAHAVNELNNQFFKFDLYGFTEDIQFTEYNSPDNHYKKHIDKSINNVIRKLSIVIQLTNPKDYEGGELELYIENKPTLMGKDQGNLYAFPSYTLHQVKPVTKGTRHSLVAWIGGPNFK
jgi:PKHD-type hydroxylase